MKLSQSLRLHCPALAGLHTRWRRAGKGLLRVYRSRRCGPPRVGRAACAVMAVIVAASASLNGAAADPLLPRPLPKPNFLTPPAREPVFFKIATGTTAGTYLSIGEALAAIISHPQGAGRCETPDMCGPEGMLAVAQASDGSIRNVTAVQAGLVSSALAQANLVDAGYHGRAPFARTGPMHDLRVIANLYPEAVHLVTRRDSSIQSLADLKGKRVSVGRTGSGTQPTALNLLRAVHLNRNNVTILEMNAYDASDLLMANALDALFFVGGTPVPLITNLVSQIPIRLVPLTGEEIDSFRDRNTFLRDEVIPDSTYDSVGEVRTLSVGALWIVNAHVSEQRVYEITRALWNPRNRDILTSGHAQGKRITLQSALDGLTIPLHPGAERYYREVGLLTAQPEAGPANTFTGTPPGGAPGTGPNVSGPTPVPSAETALETQN